MLLIQDPRCADYGSSLRPEQPARISGTVSHLRTVRPEWTWRGPAGAPESDLLRAHTPAHLKRLGHRPDFDADTPFFDGIRDHAMRAAGAALLAAECALTGQPLSRSCVRPAITQPRTRPWASVISTVSQ